MQSENPIKTHWLKGVIFILSLWVVYLSTFAQIDAKANGRLDSSFKQALGVFATAKALNGGCLLKPQSKLLPQAKASIVSRGRLLFVSAGTAVHTIK